MVGKGEDQHEIHPKPIHNQITSAPAEKKAGKAQTCTKLNVNAHTHTHTHTHTHQTHKHEHTKHTHTHKHSIPVHLRGTRLGEELEKELKRQKSVQSKVFFLLKKMKRQKSV